MQMVTTGISGRGRCMKRLFLIICVAGFAVEGDGQVSIQSAEVREMAVAPSTLFMLSVLNTGAAAEAMLEGELVSAQGEQVVQFRTQRFKVMPGMQYLRSEDLSMERFTYGSGPASSLARTQKRLPDGRYRYCFRITSIGGEGDGDYCDMLEVEEFLLLDLVDPWDGDTIEDVRPALTWALSGTPAAARDADVRLTLTPCADDRSAASVLASDRPLFVVPHVWQGMVGYPAGVTDLQRGKCYAWQAERVLDGRVVDRSEPWRFCVRDHTPQQPNKYVVLGKDDAREVHEAAGERIYFRYEEPYTSSEVACIVFGASREPVPLDLRDDREVGTGKDVVRTNLRRIGTNLYELDLAPYALKPGYYQLRVQNEGGRSHSLVVHLSGQ